MKGIHSEFRDFVAKNLIRDGYKIIGSEVKLKDLIINGQYIIIDLLVEKNGQQIPVECGNVRQPKYERILKLKEKFGSFKHIPYGAKKRTLLYKKKKELEKLK